MNISEFDYSLIITITESDMVTEIRIWNRVDRQRSERRSNAFWLDKRGQNVQIFEKVLFFNLRTT